MAIQNLCPPALIYLVFSIVQIVIDIGQGFYNTAFAKIIVATIFAILLNYLCNLGLGIISWVIVFLPFIFMSVIISVLLYVLGLSPTSGKLKVYKGNGEPKRVNNNRKKDKDKDKDKKTHDARNKIIQKQRKKIKKYEKELKDMEMKSLIGSNMVPPHSHTYTSNNNNRSIYGIYEIENKINKDKEIKKLKRALKAKNMKPKKRSKSSLNVNYDDNIRFTRLSDASINKSLDSMLNDLKKRYN